MQQGYSRTGMNRAKQRTLVIVSVVVLLAMILSFTLAWFAQLLVSRDNAILSGAGTSSVELWGQSALGGRFGGDFLDIASDDFEKTTQLGDPDQDIVGITQSYLEPETDDSPLNPSRFIPQNYLYKIVGESTDKNPSGLVYKEDDTTSDDYNRLLNDTGLLPKNRIKRRVIVYNSPDAPQNVSYNVTFPFQLTQKVDELGQPVLDAGGAPVFETVADSPLAEAIRVDVAKLTPQPGVTGVNAEEAVGLTSTVGASLKTVGDVSGIDVVQLHSKSLTGTLRPGEFDVYEFSFTFLDSASNFYETLLPDSEDMALRLDIQVTAKAGAETHYISTEAELYRLLYPGTQNPAALKDGDTIEIAAGAQLTIDNFITDKMFNLVMNTGSRLTVTDNFRVVIPKDENGQDKFGTIDILYGMSLADISTQPLQFGQNCRLVINAPKVALRWNNQTAQDSAPFIRQPDNSDSSAELNVRTFNGVEALHKGVSTDLGVRMDDFDSVEPAAEFPGAGTPENPYQIGSAATYKKLMNDVNSGIDYQNAFFIQSADFDFSFASSVLPIGGGSTDWRDQDDNPFKGHYNGNGHILENLILNQPSLSHVGAFGLVIGGTIENLGRVGGETNASVGVAGIIGTLVEGTVRNCYNDSPVTANIASGGGIVGDLLDNASQVSIVENCYNLGDITARDQVGGIMGTIGLPVENTSKYAGVYVSGCYNAGKITGDIRSETFQYRIGGLIGLLDNTELFLSGCYNVGQVTAIDDNRVGGILGRIITPVTKATISNCYYLEQSVPDGMSGVGATGSTDVSLGDIAPVPDSQTTTWPLSHGQMIGKEAVDDKTVVELLNAGLDSTLAFRAAPAGSDYRFPWVPLQEDLDYTVPVAMYITPGADGSLKYTTLAPVQPDGSGTEEDPYLIDTPNHWRWVESETNATEGRNFTGTYFKLLCNLDYDGVTDTKPVGCNIITDSGSVRPYLFSGILDGNYKLIKNFNYISSDNKIYSVGIIGGLGENGQVRNLGKVGGEISGKSHVGGIIGSMAMSSRIENCFNTGSVIASTEIAGGIVSESYDGSVIRHCYNLGNVTAGAVAAGGVVGLHSSGDVLIENCYNTGSVTITSSSEGAGALIGSKWPGAKSCALENSFALKGTEDSLHGLNPDEPWDCKLSNTAFVTNTELMGDEIIAKLNHGLDEDSPAFVKSKFPNARYPKLWWEKKNVYSTYSQSGVWSVSDELTDAGITGGDFSKLPTDGHEWEGEGTAASPWLIQTGTDYKKLIDDVQKAGNDGAFQDAHFLMTNSLDFSHVVNVGSIGGMSSYFGALSPHFRGTFDGGGHIIYNLSQLDLTTNQNGIFGHLRGATIRNLGRVGGKMSSADSVVSAHMAGFCGYIVNTTIENCFNTCDIESNDTSSPEGAGIAIAMGLGSNTNTIRNCFNAGQISGGKSNEIGGVVFNYRAECDVTNCYNVGMTSGYGVIAYTAEGASAANVNNCYYLNGTGNLDTRAASMTEAQMTTGMSAADGLLTKLGSAFKAPPAGSSYPYPWLSWMTEDIFAYGQP